MAKYEVTVRYTTCDVIEVDARDRKEAVALAIQNCSDVPDVESSAFTVEVTDLEEIE